MKVLRELHLSPDLLLIYQKQDKEIKILRLIRLGTHSQIL
jgi:addiction module RelE/StbE family toxin